MRRHGLFGQAATTVFVLDGSVTSMLQLACFECIDCHENVVALMASEIAMPFLKHPCPGRARLAA